MTLDPPANWKHAAALERGLIPQPKRGPTNYEVERDRYLEHLAEEIHIARDHLAVLEHKYQTMQQVELPHDPDPGFDWDRPGVDGRLFDQGTDASEQWRPREDVRSVQDVALSGDRL